jgi:hypothetical protein
MCRVVGEEHATTAEGEELKRMDQAIRYSLTAPYPPTLVFFTNVPAIYHAAHT